MFDTDPFHLETQLGRRVEIYPRGDPQVQSFRGRIPETWFRALSPRSAPEESIPAIWQPVLERARGFVTRLATITDDLALVAVPDPDFPPRLLYLSRLGQYARAWLAGAPAAELDRADAEGRLSLRLPASYVAFTQVHNGLLENGSPAVGFAPLDLLCRLPDCPGIQQAPGAADPARNLDRLLSFWADGLGGRQCYDLDAPGGHEDFRTIAWDPQAQAPAPAPEGSRSFWSFLKNLTVTGAI